MRYRFVFVCLFTLVGCSDRPSGDTDTDAVVDPCATDLDACEYPSLGIDYDEVLGGSVDDPVTGRTLPLLARVPVGDGPFPVVIWSHGGGFIETGHLQANDWGDAIASHGYVVLHVGHVPLTAESGLALCELAGVPTSECTIGDDEDANGLTALVKTRDVIAVLDALPGLSDASVARGGAAIDLERIAVAGWSAGARAPQLTHGAVVSLTESVPRFELVDTRPVAAVAMSPMAPGYAGFFQDGDEDSWQGMRGPVLMATGDNDLKATKPDLTGEDRRLAFSLQPADGTRWLLYSHIADVGGHGTYNLEDLASSDERLARFSRALRSSVLAFLDAHVREDAAGAAWLATDNAAVLAGEAEWEQR